LLIKGKASGPYINQKFFNGKKYEDSLLSIAILLKGTNHKKFVRSPQ